MIEETDKEVRTPRLDLRANCAYIVQVHLLKLLFEPVLNHGEIMVRLCQEIHQALLLDAVQYCAPFPLKINIKLLLRKQAFL